jgi:hypothetical protein
MKNKVKNLFGKDEDKKDFDKQKITPNMSSTRRASLRNQLDDIPDPINGDNDSNNDTGNLNTFQT